MSIDFINSNALIYDFEAENATLKEEIITLLYKRGVLDMEFNIIVDRLNHLDEDIELNDGSYSHSYYEGISDDIDRLKVLVDRIRYYDMHIDEYRKHIEHNNRLMGRV